MSHDGLRVFHIEVPVNYDQVWADAIRQGAPNTGSGWAIWGVEDQFPVDQKGIITERQRWVQFGMNYHHQTPLDYAVSERIAHIHPRGIFATTEKNPKIVAELCENRVYLNSALTCTVDGIVFVPRVEYCRDGYRRLARVRDARDAFVADSWFGFRE